MIRFRETCETCVFFSPFPGRRDSARGNDRTRGQCRAHSPTLVPDNRGPRSLWPFVYGDDGCGDHATYEDEDEESTDG